jgi:hypothetical protein
MNILIAFKITNVCSKTYIWISLAAYLRSQAYNKYGKQDAIMNAGFFWM